MDEPTNYLDIVSLEALEKSLKNTYKIMLIVSHDRAFVDAVCDYIIEIKNQGIEEFSGNYSQYINNKKEKKIKAITSKNEEEILILENRMGHVISMLCTETN